MIEDYLVPAMGDATQQDLKDASPEDILLRIVSYTNELIEEIEVGRISISDGVEDFLAFAKEFQAEQMQIYGKRIVKSNVFIREVDRITRAQQGVARQRPPFGLSGRFIERSSARTEDPRMDDS